MVTQTYAGAERRIDAVRRAVVAQMTREELERELLTDHLTGAPNRRAFQDWCRMFKPTFVAVLDVDALKWVNDHWRHEAGDDLLCAVVRAAEAVGVGVFRLGGDEFAVAFEDHEDAFNLLHKVQKRLRSEPFFTPEGMAVGARFSFGVGTTLEAADHQLIQMKRARTEMGIRPPRGERPTGLCVLSPEGDVPNIELCGAV